MFATIIAKVAGTLRPSREGLLAGTKIFSPQLASQASQRVHSRLEANHIVIRRIFLLHKHPRVLAKLAESRVQAVSGTRSSSHHIVGVDVSDSHARVASMNNESGL